MLICWRSIRSISGVPANFGNDPNFPGRTLADSSDARRKGSAWLLNGRNRRAQDLRLRIRMEKDAFSRMAPYWQRLGFPFKTMVPSYATAIGNSSDRPVALAELMGILVNDGMRRSSVAERLFILPAALPTKLARADGRDG